MNRAAAAAVAATELRLHLSACIEMLNNREREALIFLSKGLTLQQTADTMSVGLQTVMTFRKASIAAAGGNGVRGGGAGGEGGVGVMAESTSIEWCDATWSPWEGCTKVSPGCDHCYAERMNRWLKKGENWGPGAPRLLYGEDHWEKLLRWNDTLPRHGRTREPDFECEAHALRRVPAGHACRAWNAPNAPLTAGFSTHTCA